MSNLIDRQAMIEKMRNRKKLFCKNRIEFMALPKDEKARVDEIDNCISSLANAPDAELEVFEFCASGDNPCKEYDQEKHCCHRWTKFIRQTIDDLKKNENKRWISITEELPEECVDVLIQISNKDGVKMVVSQRRDVNYWSGYGRDVNVIAWMSLPEPVIIGDMNDENNER